MQQQYNNSRGKTHTISFHLMAIFQGEPGLARFIGVQDNGSGGDNWSCKTCKAPVKLSPATNQHTNFHRLDALAVDQSTVPKN